MLHYDWGTPLQSREHGTDHAPAIGCLATWLLLVTVAQVVQLLGMVALFWLVLK